MTKVTSVRCLFVKKTTSMILAGMSVGAPVIAGGASMVSTAVTANVATYCIEALRASHGYASNRRYFWEKS